MPRICGFLWGLGFGFRVLGGCLWALGLRVCEFLWAVGLRVWVLDSVDLGLARNLVGMMFARCCEPRKSVEPNQKPTNSRKHM